MSRRLAAALALSTVASAAPLALNDRPPAFALQAGTGARVSLGQHLGRDRLLIVFGPPARYLDDVRQRAKDYLERDLQVLVIVPPDSPLLKQKVAAPLSVLADPGGRVAALYGAQNGPRSYLVGKDTGIKGVYGAPPDAQELFTTIDGMPMRRQEMRR